MCCGIDLGVKMHNIWLWYSTRNIELVNRYFSYHIMIIWSWWLVVGGWSQRFNWWRNQNRTKFSKWSNGAYTCICTPAGFIENPNPSSAAFSGNSFGMKHPCLSANNLFTEYSDVNQFSSHLQYSRPSWWGRSIFNPFSSIALIHTSTKSLGQVLLARIIATKEQVWVVVLLRQRGAATRMVWYVPPLSHTHLLQNLRTQRPKSIPAHILRLWSAITIHLAKNNLSNFSSNILVHWGSSRL